MSNDIKVKSENKVHVLCNARQNGSALISALLITAIAAVISAAVIISQRLLIYHAELVTNADQLYLDLQGVQDWAEMIILKNVNLQKTPSLKQTINGTTITGNIIAQQGLFNINSLAQTINQPRFVRLLQNLVPDMSTAHASDLVRAISA